MDTVSFLHQVAYSSYHVCLLLLFHFLAVSLNRPCCDGWACPTMCVFKCLWNCTVTSVAKYKKDEISGKSVLLFWGLGATNGCSRHFSPLPIYHSSQTRQVKYFLCGLGVLVKHTHRHTKTKPFYPSPVQSCVCSRVILFWTHSPSSLSPTTGGLVKKKKKNWKG